MVNLRTGQKVALSLFTLALFATALKTTPPVVAQTANNKVTKSLGKSTIELNSHAIPLKPISAKQKQENNAAAQSINKVPGIHIEGKDLQPPAEDPEIKGFHPIKRLMAPVIRLGKGTVQLQQQVMKLEGPIGGLEPAMNSLSTKLHNVGSRLGTLDKSLVCMEEHIVNLDSQMTGIRKDLGLMEADVEGLSGPLQSVLQPLTNVHGPLEEMTAALSEMKGMITMALFAIIALTVGIVFGTPLAAVFIYKHRRKIFPYIEEHEFPVL